MNSKRLTEGTRVTGSAQHFRTQVDCRITLSAPYYSINLTDTGLQPGCSTLRQCQRIDAVEARRRLQAQSILGAVFVNELGDTWTHMALGTAILDSGHGSYSTSSIDQPATCRSLLVLHDLHVDLHAQAFEVQRVHRVRS